jgi:hypothetical protein
VVLRLAFSVSTIGSARQYLDHFLGSLDLGDQVQRGYLADLDRKLLHIRFQSGGGRRNRVIPGFRNVKRNAPTVVGSHAFEYRQSPCF